MSGWIVSIILLGCLVGLHLFGKTAADRLRLAKRKPPDGRLA